MVGSIGALAACAVLALTPHHLAAPPTASLRPPPPCRTATAAMSLDSAAKHAGSGGAAGGDGADPTLAELWSLPTDEARRDAVTEMVRGWSGDGSKGEASRPFGFPPSWFPAHCVSRPLCFPRSTTPLSPCATDSLLIFLARSLTKGVVFGWAQRAARAEEFLGRLGEVRECSHTQFSVFPPPTCQTRCLLPMFLTRDAFFRWWRPSSGTRRPLTRGERPRRRRRKRRWATLLQKKKRRPQRRRMRRQSRRRRLGCGRVWTCWCRPRCS